MLKIGLSASCVRTSLALVLRIGICCTILLAFLWTPANAEDAKKSFDIPAGQAIETLKNFSIQANARLLYSVEAVSNVRTKPVNGAYTPLKTLEIMLASTGLVAIQNQQDGAFAVTRAGPSKSESARKKIVMKKPTNTPLSLLVALVLPLVSSNLQAQQPTTSGNTTSSNVNVSGEEAVMMSPFDVIGNPVTPYQASEASAGARVAVNLFDLTQSVSVVTNATIKDLGAENLLDATLLMPGISNSSQPYIDRLSIRGFQVNNAGDVDGFFLPATACQMDPVMFDRIELVRGPSAVLTPAASPGGTMNIVTKVAQFQNFESVTIDEGRYNTGDYSFDINRDQNNFAYRLVAGYQNYTQGDNQGYHQAITIMPSVMWQISPNTRLLLQYTYRWAIMLNGLGFPIDPSVGPFTPLKMLSGMNIYQTPYADSPSDLSAQERDNTQTYRLLLTSKVTDAFSMRVSARIYYGWESYDQWNLLGNTGGALDPLTGFWTPEIVYGPAPTFTPKPAPPTTGIYSLSQSPGNVYNNFYDIQNDYVYKFLTNDYVHSETTGGWAAEFYHIRTKGYAASSPPIDIFDIPSPALWSENPDTHILDANTISDGNFLQAYLNEELRFWHDRVIVNAGAAQTYWYQETTDLLRKTSYGTSPNRVAKNYGIDFQPVPSVSIYYGHSEAGIQVNNAPSASTPYPPDLQWGVQDEDGLRFKLLGGRALLTVDHYDLSQSNNAITNPLLFSVPPPTILPSPLLESRVAKGWEYEMNVPLSDEWSFIANATNFRSRMAIL